MAAKLAARNVGTLSKEEAAQLLERGRSAIEVGSVASLTAADMAFHMWIYESAGNPLLTDTLRLYWHHLRRAMTAVIEPSQDRALVWSEHSSILEAVLRGDQRNAERLSLAHVHEAAQRVMQNVPE